jgi:membrane glycosyltransferase
MQWLRETGRAEDTDVFVASDHGYSTISEIAGVLATSKSGTLLLRRDQGEMAVFWDSRSRRL